jgi:hypothetical protein
VVAPSILRINEAQVFYSLSYSFHYPDKILALIAYYSKSRPMADSAP